MYEMAKKAREAMRGKAKRLAGEKDQKVDSSNWTPAEPLNADVKTGMRPLSPQGFRKSGGKAEGEKNAPRADRKARKSGGRAITADSLMNRDQKEANESREGKKHIGGMKKGGRAGKALGGMPTDMLKGSMNPSGLLNYLQSATGLKLKKGGKVKKAGGGSTAMERIRDAAGYNKDKSPVTDPSYKGDTTSDEDKKALQNKIEGMKKGGRTARKAGGNVNYGPAENVGGKPGVSMKEQMAIEAKGEAASKPKRGKAAHYADAGAVPVVISNPGPGYTPGMNMSKDAMSFGVGAKGSPYKKGGMAKHEDVAEDKALIKKMVKPEARTKKYGGGGISGLNMGPAKAYGGERSDKPKAAKKGMNVSITINTGPKPEDQAMGLPGMPPGLPPKPGGIPVPMGMPPAGGAPPAAAPVPMPMPMPMPPAGGGMPPMARKAGGKVYRSYKDLDAGAGSGLGRLEKTEIQKRKA